MAFTIESGVIDYVLSLEDERTVLVGTPGAPPVLVVGAGWRTIARDYLKHDPPSPLELENAIGAIEDQIARAGALPAKGSPVRTNDALVREIAVASGLPRDAETIFALSAVEQAYQRLAAQASRGLRSGDGLAAGNGAAAALVILRELMHHLGFPAIIVHSP
jgi:hypothetical protein